MKAQREKKMDMAKNAPRVHTPMPTSIQARLCQGSTVPASAKAMHRLPKAVRLEK